MPKRTPAIGDRLLVKPIDLVNVRDYEPAEILERRIRTGFKKQKTESKLDNLPPDAYDYYVHYAKIDRRSDQWVPYKHINFSEEVDDSEFASNHSPERARKSRRRRSGEISEAVEQKDKELAKMEKQHEAITKIKNIEKIRYGGFKIHTWYYSPFPDDYHGCKVLYMCDYCLKYSKNWDTYAKNHGIQCKQRGPPGAKIYDHDGLTMFEIIGKEHRLYCQNLCLLSKLFLDHKTLYFDVEPFLFYVLCEMDESGNYVVVGYFSKEKQSQENYNLACILTLPPWQKRGYGKFLISVSYELTKREQKTGSPEKPLSDLGQISYRSYWSYVLLNFLVKHQELVVSSEALSKATGINHDDVLYTLDQHNLLRHYKGQHVICLNAKVIKEKIQSVKSMRLCHPEFLTWQPASS